MKILVLQHAGVEHPGIFRKFLKEDGHEWYAIHLDQGEALPPIEDYDGLWVLGGPMDVWEEQKYPWLVEEKKYIQQAVEEKGVPFLGLCLGHQLLAEALGGKCGLSDTPEIGVLDISITEDGAETTLLDGLPEKFSALQWHSAEIKQMPAGAKCLATSNDCAVQAMSWGPRAYSLQFHIEVEDDTVEEWDKIPEYNKALNTALGKTGADQLKAEVYEKTKEFEILAERLYMNWLQTCARVV